MRLNRSASTKKVEGEIEEEKEFSYPEAIKSAQNSNVNMPVNQSLSTAGNLSPQGVPQSS